MVNTGNNDLMLLIGRILLGVIFAKAVFSLISGSVPVEFAAKGAKFIPLPEVAVWVGFIIKAVAGICLLLGFKTRTAAFALIVFTLMTAFNYHDIGGNVFMKEISMVGGLLVLAATGAGRWSFDRK